LTGYGDEAIHFSLAQLAARQPKLRASGLEGGASAQLENGLLRFARNDA
jgi:hypothetical protein